MRIQGWQLLLVAGIATLGGNVSVNAQDRRVLEEVIVTAQKREQTLQDIPMSVSAISGELAAEAAIVDTSELVQYTPNVKFTASNPQYSSTTIRGFGTPPLGRNLEPSVGLVIDGVSYGRSTFTNDGVFDLERLEVLRGPQGTLFGKNTVAGVLNFTTKRPSFEWEGYVAVAEESLDGKRYEFASSIPIIEDVLAARVSWRRRFKSLGLFNTARNNEEEEFEDESLRLKVDWFPHEDIEISAVAFRTEFESVGNGMQYLHTTPFAMERYRAADPQAEDDAFNDTTSKNSPTFTERKSDAIALTARFAMGDFLAFTEQQVEAIASWAQVDTPFQLDADFGPGNSSFLNTDGPERYKQEQFELRYSASSEPLFGWGEAVDWVFGAFWGKSLANTTQFSHVNIDGVVAGLPLILAGRGLNTPDEQTQFLIDIGFTAAQAEALQTGADAFPGGNEDTIAINKVVVNAETYALFSQVDWHLSQVWTATLGLRLGKEFKDGAQSSNADTPVARLIAGQQNFTNASNFTEYEVSPKFALSWSFSEESTVFWNVAKGFKSGGYSGPLIAPVNLEYEAEEAVSTELGIKSRLFDETLSLNATVYYVEFDELQLNLFDGTQISTANTGDATSYGLEIDFQWLPPIPWLTVQGSVGFNETRYGDFPCGPTAWDDNDALPECGDDAPPSQDLTGETLAYVPDVSASLTPMIRFPIWPKYAIGGMFAIDILHQGEHYLDPDLDPVTFQEATTKLNARLAIAPQNRRWAVIMNAKNLTEEQERLLDLDVQQQGGNYVSITKPDEVQYSLELRYNFGPLG